MASQADMKDRQFLAVIGDEVSPAPDHRLVFALPEQAPDVG
jgi:hypothetical protein